MIDIKTIETENRFLYSTVVLQSSKIIMRSEKEKSFRALTIMISSVQTMQDLSLFKKRDAKIGKQMKKIILLYLLFFQIVFAETNNFFKHISSIQNINFDKISSLNQYEHNATQKRIKNEIEALLPSYLSVKDLSKNFTTNNFKYISAIDLLPKKQYQFQS